MVPPSAQREPKSRRFFERRCLLRVQTRVRVAAAAGIDRVHDGGELVPQPQHTQGMDPHRHHAGDGIRRSHDVRRIAVPHAGRVLGAADRLECAAAPAVEISVDATSAVDFGGLDPRVLRRFSVDSITPDSRIEFAEDCLLRRRGALDAADIRLHVIGPAGDSKADRALRSILAGQKLVGVLEEPSLELFPRWKVDENFASVPLNPP